MTAKRTLRFINPLSDYAALTREVTMPKTEADRIVELRDMLAALHYEALGFARHEGSPFDSAMERVEREFGRDPDFAKRFEARP